MGAAVALTALYEDSVTAFTLAAGVPQVWTWDTSQVSNLAIVIANTGGANPIGTIQVQRSPLGTLFGTDASIVGPLAASTNMLIELVNDQIATSQFKLTLLSAAGTTVSFEFRGISGRRV